MPMELNPEYAAFAVRALSKARRTAGESSPLAFAQLYLRDLLSRPFSPMHREFFKVLATFHNNRGSRLAIAAPRGHAKSTIATLVYVVWCLVYAKEQFIVVASGNEEQANRLLNHVKGQLESNPLIRADFPELVPQTRSPPWRKNGILLGNQTMLVSCASSQNPRGIRHRSHRPTLFIADDLESKELVASELQRVKLAEWFSGTFLKAGSPETNTIVVGTILHPESLLARLMDPVKSPGWTVMLYKAVLEESSRPDLWDHWREIMRSRREYQGNTGTEGAKLFHAENAIAMNEGAVVLWPDEYSYHKLMKIRLQDGETAFQSEYQNEPMDPERCIFAAAPFIYWDEKDQTVDELIMKHGAGRFICACDPSMGANKASDFSAVVVVFRPIGSHKKFVIEADIKRRPPSEIIQCIMQFSQMYHLHEIVVEANGFQQIMVTDLKRHLKLNHHNVPVKSVTTSVNKIARISGLEAEISQGHLVFSRRHTLLLSQLRHFPDDKHDDGPDALQMGVDVANNFRGIACRIWT